jgi:hypothetical protein
MAILRTLVSTCLVAIAFANLWQLNQTLRWVKPREADDVAISEDRLRYIRDALMKAGYWRGDIGYMPAGVLQGRARTPKDDQYWVITRYVMIPWNVVQDSLAPAFVLVDATRSDAAVEPPNGFVKVYDSTDGLVLIKKLSK